MARKRTRAERSAAAKKAWQLRKLKGAKAPTPVVAGTEALLTERNSTHGSFVRNAEISQQIKMLIERYGADLHVVQREALDMIALKMSRILSGQAAFADHWDDIAGYAVLAKKTS